MPVSRGQILSKKVWLGQSSGSNVGYRSAGPVFGD